MRTILEFDAGKEERRVKAFIKRVLSESGATGLVIGISGGVDSAVAGALCVRAVGKERVLAVLMPTVHTPPADTKDAEGLAELWGSARVSVPISSLVDGLISAVRPVSTKVAKANVQARLRMAVLYYLSNSQNRLVVGTGDRSEEILGFFTKYGDGGVDLLPIAHLYKTQVRMMGRHLGIPQRIVDKPASPQLWPGHTAREELPEDYEKLDLVMHYLFDERASRKETSRKAGVDEVVIERVLEMHSKTAHKRALPPSLRPPAG